MKSNLEDTYPDFEQPACALSKFHTAGDIFTIMLKDKTIIHHTPVDADAFRKWLLNAGISDIKVIGKE